MQEGGKSVEELASRELLERASRRPGGNLERDTRDETRAPERGSRKVRSGGRK